MADDAAGLLDALNIPKAHVFGVSMGGAIAQEFALKYPEKLDKLILGCTMAGGNCSQMGDVSGVMNGNLLDLLFTPTFIQNHHQQLAKFLAETTAKVEPFFHLPAMLMTSEIVAAMKTSDEVIGVFETLMNKLKEQKFKESKIIGSLQVTQLSDNQGIVSEVAKRFDDEDKEIEHFGFTYTLRKVTDEWKIIVGVIHVPGTLSRSIPI